MQDQSEFLMVRVIDYRNGRYQGLLHNKTNKRNGFGIVFDDDLNLYCSEWQQGELHGMTVIVYSNGQYMYGQWKEGKPHGLVVLFNKLFTVYVSYVEGQPSQKAIAIDDSFAKLIVFNGQDMRNLEAGECTLYSCDKIWSDDVFQDYLSDMARKNGFVLSREEINIRYFMAKLSRKHHQIIIFNQNFRHSYFGYHNGLGIKFSSRSGSNQLMLSSIGHHTNYQLSQIGVKYFDLQCTEVGNFQTKQTISYNKYGKKPSDKCELIFQNFHKKSLNFVNAYFDLKADLMQNMHTFLNKKFLKSYENYDIHYESKSQTDNKKLNIPAQRQNFYREAKEQYIRKAEQNRNKNRSKSKSPQIIDKKYPKMISEKSRPKQRLERRQEKNKQLKTEPQDNSLNHLVKQLQVAKRNPIIRQSHLISKGNEGSKSRSNKKVNYGRIVKSPLKSKVEKETDHQKIESPPKGIRYLNDYLKNKQQQAQQKQKQPSQDQKQQIIQDDTNKNIEKIPLEGLDNIQIQTPIIKFYKVSSNPSSKNTSSNKSLINSNNVSKKSAKKITPPKISNNSDKISKKQKFDKRESGNEKMSRKEIQEKNIEELQLANQLKIRQEIADQEAKRSILLERGQSIRQIQDIFELMNKVYKVHHNNNEQAKLLKDLRKPLNAIDQERLNHQKYLQRSTNLRDKYYQQSAYDKPFSLNYQQLEEKRSKLLKNFLQLNEQFNQNQPNVNSYFPEVAYKYTDNRPERERSMYTQLQSSRQHNVQKNMDSRCRAQRQFNKKYRNYLRSQKSSSPNKNHVYKVEALKEPMISKFSPQSSNFYQLSNSGLSRSRKKRKYEYVFE